jgi:integrase/recombinase XerD
MLRIYRRHGTHCHYRSERDRRCKCPIYVEGTLGRESIRRSLDQTSWDAATELVNHWTASGKIGLVKSDAPSIDDAIKKFFLDAEARQLQPPTIRKHRVLLENRLLPWCATKGYRDLRQLTVDALRDFRAAYDKKKPGDTRKDSALSAYKNLERLRSFFGFCQQSGWIDINPAKALKPPKVPEKSTKVKVFTQDEIQQILDACDAYPQQNAYGHDNRARIKALVLTLRYSGMRIGDVVGLQKSHLKGDKLFLNTQKSGSKIYVPLPKVAVDALGAIENGSAYFFWTGNGLRKSAVADWQRAIRRLFDSCDVTGHPHMFRHTFATDLLARGIPIEDVSVLLGHKSVRITEAYYSHWIKARRDRLEERVRELWA